jgi:hypothetical protein
MDINYQIEKEITGPLEHRLMAIIRALEARVVILEGRTVPYIFYDKNHLYDLPLKVTCGIAAKLNTPNYTETERRK